ncbi:MAG: alpha/beta fold hydrolase [Reyranella sp.]|nr:alpha/beta fold hydrolase [Reyranella sp.]
MIRLAPILATALLLIVLVGALGVWVGIPYLERRWTFFPARSAAADRFDLLLFNYRGFGKSDGATLGEATLALDGAAALRYLTKERVIDPKSIALLGVSLGSAVAADLAMSSPCRAVALIGAFASAKKQAAELQAWLSKP